MKQDHILDSIALSYKPIHNGFSPSDYTNNEYHRRCKAIKKELKENGMKAQVHRHSLFGVDYIVVIFDKKTNGFIDHATKKMSEALQIPSEWIGMVQCCDPQEYFIKEDEFLAKYPSANTGTIDFKEGRDEV